MATGKKTTKKAGRPTMYTKGLGDELFGMLAQGISLRTVCELPHMPTTTTFFRWMRTVKGFSEQYAQAKEESADAMAEEILHIADSPIIGEEITIKGTGKKQMVEVSKKEMLGHRRLQIDTRKFLMSKMKPKRYGDKLDLTTDGEKLPTPIYGGQSRGPKAK